jgi:hypothetical protein
VGDTNLEVDVDVIPEHVHAEELAPADLTGVLLVAMGEQMLVHVASAREHLGRGAGMALWSLETREAYLACRISREQAQSTGDYSRL